METLDESVELFKKYQIAVHNDEPYECDKQSFLNFLGKTPLQVNKFIIKKKIIQFIQFFN